MRSVHVLGSLSLATGALGANSPLAPLILTPLDLGQIKASGWLHDQLMLSASGLGGHLMDFWRFVSDSAWLGGNSEYSILHESFPYWFNYMVPLAYSLDDARLLSQVRHASDRILAQAEANEDGWIGYEQGTARNLWPRCLVCMALMQLAQADGNYTDRAVAALWRFARLVAGMLDDDYRGYRYHAGDDFTENETGWGLARAQDLMIPLMWLYETHPTGDDADQAALLRAFRNLYEGGISWDYWFRDDVFPRGRPIGAFYEALPVQYFHGVNEAMALKATAVYRRFMHNDTMAQLARQGVNWTFAYHGSASGSILADETIDGQMGYMGYETCTTVEAMYSLNYLYQALGDGTFADMAELAAFNALPGALAPDWWARQYVSQPNQPWTRELTASPFYDVDVSGQQYTLEGNYPCCTVNHAQGYPKFLSAVFAHGPRPDELAHALLAPARVDATLRDGTKVVVNVTTRYPFGLTLRYDVFSDGAFTLSVRVPSWADAASSVVRVGDGPATRLTPDALTGLHAVVLPAGPSTMRYELGATLRVEPRPNGTVAVHHGALVYALDIPANNSSTVPSSYKNKTGKPLPAPAQARDWTMENTGPWNYAIDPSTLTYHGGGKDDLPNPIWSPGAPPNHVTAKACLIDWPLLLATTPDQPPPVDRRKCVGPVTDVVLRPFGSTKLRVGDLPTIDLGDQEEI